MQSLPHSWKAFKLLIKVCLMEVSFIFVGLAHIGGLRTSSSHPRIDLNLCAFAGPAGKDSFGQGSC